MKASCLRPFLITTLLGLTLTAQAVTLRVANQGDALSMDPHSLNETLQISVVSNVYEPLVMRGRDYKLAPALATSWKQTAPTVWRFELRKGVTFHDGTPFTADDVLFSFERAGGDGSDMKSYVGSIKEIKKINDHTLDFVTNTKLHLRRWVSHHCAGLSSVIKDCSDKLQNVLLLIWRSM